MSGAFPVRGIIEGFYGVPWTHVQRLDMIDFVAEIGMNAFVYGPKDDRFLRRSWREPYAAAELAALGELVTRANERGVAFTFALSPGLSMQYSSAEDLELLVAKYQQVRSLGVSSFALLLDDIPPVLQHPSDRAAFDSLVSAQIALVSRLFTTLGESGEVALMVCPTVYWGRGDEPYIAELGQGIDPAIDLLWTGRAICSAELDAVDAERFLAASGHPPLYWDNFPVNDVAMTHELHIGPYLGREPGLAQYSRGVIANAMPYAEASKIAFVSIADFLADPAGFDAEASWERALRLVAGDDYEVVRHFADALRGSCLCTDDAPRLGARLESFAFEYSFGDRASALAGLATEAEHMRAVSSALIEGRIANQAFADEVRPWAEQYRRGADALLLCAGILAKGEPDEADRAVIRSRLDEIRVHRLRVFGDLVDMFLSDLAGEFERS